ncbi:hypothetical protein D3C76_1744750 [compost metagenome]
MNLQPPENVLKAEHFHFTTSGSVSQWPVLFPDVVPFAGVRVVIHPVAEPVLGVDENLGSGEKAVLRLVFPAGCFGLVPFVVHQPA